MGQVNPVPLCLNIFALPCPQAIFKIPRQTPSPPHPSPLHTHPTSSPERSAGQSQPPADIKQRSDADHVNGAPRRPQVSSVGGPEQDALGEDVQAEQVADLRVGGRHRLRQRRHDGEAGKGLHHVQVRGLEAQREAAELGVLGAGVCVPSEH